MGPQNAPFGSGGFDIPQTEVDNQVLEAEQRMAKFSRTKEFGILRAYMESRMEYYKQFQPGGEGTGKPMTNAERGEAWAVADAVIKEFRSVIAEYEQAAETVKNARRQG